MSNKAHGDYKIAIENNIVFGYPTGSFNEEGLRYYYQDILSRTQHLGQWAYLVQPSKDFGLTPQATEIVQVCLQNLIKNGCIAIGIKVQSMLSENIASQLKLGQFVSLKIAEDVQSLEQFLLEQLNQTKETVNKSRDLPC